MSTHFVDINLPANSLQKLEGIRNVTLRQYEYAHDLLTVDVTGYRDGALNVRSNDPVEASIYWHKQTLPFVGYVHAVEPTDQVVRQQKVHRVHIMGSSYRMKSAQQRAWQGRTASEVAAQIAQEYHLVPVIEAHPYRFELLTQPGISDWRHLVRLAKRIGYIVYVNQTTLYFHSRGYNYLEQQNAAPILNYLPAKEQSTTTTEVMSFRSVLSESMPWDAGSKAVRTLRGVDPRTHTVIGDTRVGSTAQTTREESPQGLFQEYDTATPVLSRPEAFTRNQGQEEVGKYQHRAWAEIKGNQRLHQGQSVFVTGVDKTYAGYWNTIGVTHRFAEANYFMDLDLGTNSLGQPLLTQTPRRIPSSNSSPAVISRLLSSNSRPVDLTNKSQRGGANAYYWAGQVVNSGRLVNPR